MCRGKNNGDRRCPHDSSEARKRRRRAVKGRELYNQPIILDPDTQKLLPEDKALKDIKELRKEAQLISALLHAPVNKDPKIQAEIDAKNELLVTRLGNQLAMEAERRAKFNKKRFDAEYEKMSSSFTAATEVMRKAREEEKEARMDYIEATGGTWKPGNDPQVDPETLAELKRLAEEKKQALTEAEAQWNVEDKLDNERRDKLKEKAIKKFTDAYKAVLAEIRPVGGNIPDNDRTDAEALKMLRDTVGKDYPSAWIQASSERGAVAILAQEGRAHHNEQERFEGEKAIGLPKEVTHYQTFLPVKDAEALCRKLSEDGDPVTISGGIVNLRGSKEDMQAVRFPERFPFDPTKDAMGKNGKPVGAGWKYGYTIEDLEASTLSKEKQWYRHETNEYGVMPAIVIAPSSDPASRIHAYHEAVHRFESSVGDGKLMGRMQEAFLKRRTTVNGVRKEMTIMNMASSLHDAELTRDGGFMIEYIGRDYPTKNDHREVLAVGSEAAFGGKYGAFLGLDKYHREDRDHRAFVLGAFATA